MTHTRALSPEPRLVPSPFFKSFLPDANFASACLGKRNSNIFLPPQLIRFLQIQSEKPTSAAAAKFSKRNLFWLVKSHLISQPNNLLVSQASYWLICSEIFFRPTIFFTRVETPDVEMALTGFSGWQKLF